MPSSYRRRRSRSRKKSCATSCSRGTRRFKGVTHTLYRALTEADAIDVRSIELAVDYKDPGFKMTKQVYKVNNIRVQDVKVRFTIPKENKIGVFFSADNMIDSMLATHLTELISQPVVVNRDGRPTGQRTRFKATDKTEKKSTINGVSFTEWTDTGDFEAEMVVQYKTSDEFKKHFRTFVKAVQQKVKQQHLFDTVERVHIYVDEQHTTIRFYNCFQPTSSTIGDVADVAELFTQMSSRLEAATP